MSLLDENLNITLGKVQDNCSSIGPFIYNTVDSKALRTIFELPLYDETQLKFWKIHKEISHDGLSRRAHQRLMDAFANMDMENLTGSGILWELELNNIHIDGVIAKFYNCHDDPRSDLRTTATFELYRLNKRNQYKIVAKVAIADHWAHCDLWRGIARIWSEYPKNGGQFHGKNRWGLPYYQRPPIKK